MADIAEAVCYCGLATFEGVPEVKALRAEVERLRAALERYGEHETGCVEGDRCNCGLLAALTSHVKNGSDCTCPNDEYHNRIWGV